MAASGVDKVFDELGKMSVLEARIEQLGGEGAGDTGDTAEETPAEEASASTAAEEEEQ